MPVYNVYPSTNPPLQPPQVLQHLGLVLPVEIHVPARRAAFLAANNQPLPQPVVGEALVDTGASVCAVEETCLQSLGLRPVRQVRVSTPAGTQLQNLYFVRLSFPGTQMPPAERPVLGSDFAQGRLVVLVGREVLSQCVLIYNGPMGACTISF